MTTQIFLHYKKVLAELSQLIGFKDIDALSAGGKLRVNDSFTASFILDEKLSPDRLLVYIDLGPLRENRDRLLAQFMKINFELAAGARGTLSMHPESEHLFFSFGVVLNDLASGEALLEHILRFVAWLGSETADAGPLPTTGADADGKSLAAAERARAARLIQKIGGQGLPD